MKVQNGNKKCSAKDKLHTKYENMPISLYAKGICEG